MVTMAAVADDDGDGGRDETASYYVVGPNGDGGDGSWWGHGCKW